MRRNGNALCFALPLLLSALHAGVTFGQTDAKADAKVEARAHFEKGVAAFDARRLNEAAAEFDAAYRLSPAFVVLYNIGQVNVALGRPIEAVQAFSQYLDQGGQLIPTARQHEVRAEIDTQAARIGTLAIFARPEGAEVRVDAERLGQAPLPQPARLAAGKHTIHITLANYLSEVREVDVAGGRQIEIQIDLAPVVAAMPSTSPPPPEHDPNAAASMNAPQHDDTSPRHGQEIAGWALGGAGLVATGIGLVLALTSMSQADSARQRLGNATDGPRWDDAKSDYDSAKSRNQTGWIIAGCGVAGAIAGAVLVITAPSPVPEKHDPHVELTPWFLPTAAGLNARSSW